jgi:hypothetical protein
MTTRASRSFFSRVATLSLVVAASAMGCTMGTQPDGEEGMLSAPASAGDERVGSAQAAITSGTTQSVVWVDNKNVQHVRIFTVKGTQITELCSDGAGWYTGNFMTTGTSVGAAGWLDSGGQIHLRVYSSSGNAITESCFDGGGWYVGAFPGLVGNVYNASAEYNVGAYYPLVLIVNMIVNGTLTEMMWDGTDGWLNPED